MDAVLPLLAPAELADLSGSELFNLHDALRTLSGVAAALRSQNGGSCAVAGRIEGVELQIDGAIEAVVLAAQTGRGGDAEDRRLRERLVEKHRASFSDD